MILGKSGWGEVGVYQSIKLRGYFALMFCGCNYCYYSCVFSEYVDCYLYIIKNFSVTFFTILYIRRFVTEYIEIEIGGAFSFLSFS